MMSKYAVLMVGTLQNLIFGSAFLFEGYWLWAIMMFIIGFMFVVAAIRDVVR